MGGGGGGYCLLINIFINNLILDISSDDTDSTVSSDGNAEDGEDLQG